MDITITDISMTEKANELHIKANELCFVANSLNFPVHHKPIFIQSSSEYHHFDASLCNSEKFPVTIQSLGPTF